MKQLMVLIMLCCLYNCTSQTKKEPAKEKNTVVKNDTIKKRRPIIKKDTLKINIMERFDIKKYDSLEIDSKYSNNPLSDIHFKLNDDRIRIVYYKEKIEVEETNINDPFSISKVFFKTTKSLQFIGKEFYDFSIGLSKEYNKDGTLIKETNWDLPYTFSIEGLNKKMKDEYGINIMDVNQIFTIIRGVDENNLSHYIVTIETRSHEFQEYLIDAKTGKTLYISEPSYGENEKGIIEQYLSKIARKKNLHTRYKGKDYTEEEWKAYQKTDKYKEENPSVWDSIFRKKRK